MGQVIQVNGDYTIKARRPGGAKITFDTGPGGSVSVTGDLQVLGTTQTFNSQVISDVILVLNRGETGAGVTLGKSGIEIDRGPLDRADFLFDESIDAWTITQKSQSTGLYSFNDSNLMVRNILADPNTDNGDLTLIRDGTGIVKVSGTTDYETRVIDYSRLPSVAMTHIARSSSGHTVTVTTDTNHGLNRNDNVYIHCSTFPSFNNTVAVAVESVPSATTFTYVVLSGADLVTTPVSGYVIKDSLLWSHNGANVPTDDYIPNMRAVSDYSRSLVDAAISHFSTSHIEDQNSNVTVYDSETAGNDSNITFTVDGIERVRIVGNGTTSSITTPATTFNLINDTATAVNFAGAGTTINVGSASTGTVTNLKNAEVKVGNGTTSSITTPATTFNLINDTATAVNFAGAGTTINVGSATTGTTTNLKNAEVKVGNGTTSSITTPATTFNLINDTATAVNFAGAGTLVNVGNTTGVGLTNLLHDVVNIGTGTASTLTTPSASFSLLDSATYITVGLSGTTINMGATAGQTNIRNPLLTVGTSSVAKTIIATPSLTCDLINTGSTTVNFAGAGTTINVGSGAVSTITNLKNAEIKVGNGTTSSITTPATTFNLVNTTATTVNFAGAGTLVNVGSATTGTVTNLKNAEVKVGNGTTSSITTPATTFNLINDTTTAVNFAGAGTTINVGSATTGTVTNLKNAEIKVGNGTTSSITTPATTFNLVNTTATTVNFAGAGTVVNIGSSSGTTTVKNNLAVTGTTTFTGTVSGIDISMIANGISYSQVQSLIAAAIAALPPPP
jgi:hypothetical protein